jgi:DNA helicase II / ATP-dependent DNA helicase PcrA
MIDYKSELNSEQYRVVTEGDGHCLVLAGAGSGKTRTITYRVAYLLDKGVAPNEILLVTFTNKAAREMVKRVGALTEIDKKLPWAGTFHHICYRLMKKYGTLLGYKNNFTILDSGDSKDLIKLCVKEESVPQTAKKFPSANVLLSLISYSRNAMSTIEDIIEEKHPQWLDFKDDITRIAIAYARRKKEANAMDFDDLLVNVCLLLAKSEKVRTLLSQQFKYVLVDEYQDTNKIQASIVRYFASAHKNLLVVGDDAQSIYSFRAAEIKNILDFTKMFDDAKIFKLETNYRSTPEILNVANDVISNNKKQYEKVLRAHKDPFAKPEVHAFEDREEEAHFVANRILTLIDEGVELKNMSVLFRASHHSQALEVELTKRDIPYDYRGGVRFFERAHIKDVLAYLRIFANKDDAIAWGRVLGMQTGIGTVTAQKIIGYTRTMNFNDISEKLPARAKLGWANFLSIYRELQQLNIAEPSALIMCVRHSKYEQHLQSEFPNFRERIQDIEQLAEFAARQPDLQQFLAEASLQESYTNPSKRGGQQDEDMMILSTIHQSKGLEWDAVFVLNLSNGQFPNDRALREKGGLEEERRLFYVAITRARRHLCLTYPLLAAFNTLSSGPSVFLEEIDSDILDMHHISGGNVWSDPSDDVDDVVYVSMDDEWKNKKKSFLSDIMDM